MESIFVLALEFTGNLHGTFMDLSQAVAVWNAFNTVILNVFVGRILFVLDGQEIGQNSVVLMDKCAKTAWGTWWGYCSSSLAAGSQMSELLAPELLQFLVQYLK